MKPEGKGRSLTSVTPDVINEKLEGKGAQEQRQCEVESRENRDGSHVAIVSKLERFRVKFRM